MEIIFCIGYVEGAAVGIFKFKWGVLGVHVIFTRSPIQQARGFFNLKNALGFLIFRKQNHYIEFYARRFVNVRGMGEQGWWEDFQCFLKRIR